MNPGILEVVANEVIPKLRAMRAGYHRLAADNGFAARDRSFPEVIR
jgi:hypothetical protein